VQVNSGGKNSRRRAKPSPDSKALFVCPPGGPSTSDKTSDRQRSGNLFCNSLAEFRNLSQLLREGVAPDLAGNDASRNDQPIVETTYEIVLHDSQSAARHLARILHLEVKNRPPEARRPTDDELAHRMADLLERARANGRREGAAAQRPAQTTESHSYNVSTAGQNKQSALPPRPTMIVPVPDMTTTDQTDQSRPRLQKQPSDIKARDNQASITSGRITQGFASGRADGRGAESYLDPVEKLPGGSSEPGILGALSQVPIRNGLWNRIFAGAPTLTFINS